MGKNDKSGLGRALVRHHNHMIQESKEKGQLYYKQHKKVLESITDVNDIDAVIQQADDAVRLFSADNPTAVTTLIDLESSSSTHDMTPEERRRHQKKEEALHASSLSVPRRPAWNAKMSVEELDANERRSFLVWRRSLARLEENDTLVLTPFEKNLDIWRQLWRVVERSDLLVMVVDARDPLFYRCPDLEAYAREIDEHKRTLLLINKADLLPFSVRLKWAKYFRLHGILYVFWSAKVATAELEGKTHVSSLETNSSLQGSVDDETKLYGREELLSHLQSEAEEIVQMRSNSQSNRMESPYQEKSVDAKSEHVTVGFVGYPNVGKSSTINALVGAKRTGVTSTPGKTKHFQTLIITEKLTLCDCPGLVFPSFTSSRYEMIASGVLPIHRMTEHREAVQVVADHVPRHIIEGVYNITLPKPKPYEPENRPPMASELLRAYCASRGYVASSGLPDETKAARQILKDYIDGKLPHYEMPPGTSDEEANLGDAAASNARASDESDSDSDSDSCGETNEGGARLEDVLDDLNSFDMANGLASSKGVSGARKKVASGASYKHHKKPQRKKDRAWGPFSASSPLVGKETDKSMRDKFSKIEMLTVRYQLNCKKNKVDEYRKTTAFPTQQLNHHLFNDHNNDNPKDEACKMPLSKSLVGGSMNVCKTRVLNFVQTERVPQGNGFSLVPKSRTRMILSEKRDDGTVAMHYGELDDCDYLSAEECLPTLPNTHVADLLAAQFCTLIAREGYHVEGDRLQPKPTNMVRSSGDQPNNASGVSPNAEMQQIPEAVSGQPSNEVAKPSDSGPNNASVNSSQSMPGARMHPPANSQALQISQGGLLPGVSMPQSRPLQSESQTSFQQQQQQNQHSLMLQRSSAMMLASNPLSHLNAMGQNSNMQQLGHMLNKTSPLQLQMLQQQQQQQQQPQMQRKMMMGLGNVGMGGSTGNNMVGLQGMGNVMGMGGARAGTGISPPMTGPISGMANSMGQNPININQASSISNVINQQLRSGMITPAQAAIMTTKLRMAQSRNILGGAGGQCSNISGLPGANRQVHPGSSSYSMLGPSINRANNMNPMQRTAMAPPKLMSGMNVYMNQQQQQQQQQLHVQQQQQQMPQQLQQLPQQQQQQQQESTSPLQAVLSPPQQVGSPSMGLPQQQASPQQMSQRTPMSPQLSSGGIHPPMSAGNQEGTCPASPQLSSQTMGSVSSMTNSPMEMQGVNKSS